MTECERLIANGTFTRDFFKPEVRCDFLVDEKRKKLWALQIDLYCQLAKVCKRHGLRYFASGGTILGAVRHKGFIPWDDDIDIDMPRADYEQLWNFADEFPEPYFLQIPGRDHEYCFSYTKLRNSLTTQCSRPHCYCDFNQGVQIDIFPVDRWVSEKGEQSFNRINQLNIDNSNYLRQALKNPTPAERDRIAAWSGRDPRENLAEISRLATQFNDDDSALVMTIPVSTIYPHSKIQFPKHAFDADVEFPFEGVMMVLPSGYETILNMQYGDWHAFPPLEKRGNWHDGAMLDPDVPYQAYLEAYRKEHS